MEKKVKQVLFKTAEIDLIRTEDLFAIQGGEDEDFDEDCYLSQCVVSTNTCFSPKSDCYFMM